MHQFPSEDAIWEFLTRAKCLMGISREISESVANLPSLLFRAHCHTIARSTTLDAVHTSEPRHRANKVALL
jgi:hypothetical protein